MVYKIDNATAATTEPTVGAVGPNPNGSFTSGNPSTGVPATIVDQDFMNMLQDELANAVTAAGLTPIKGSNNQLAAAIGAVPHGRLLNIQKFTASGTYVPTSGAFSVLVEVLGGGGGGGGCAATSSGATNEAGGGAAGAYYKSYALISGLASRVVSVGAGGNGGAGVSASPGSGGGASNFCGIGAANGGGGGLGVASNSAGSGGNGGTTTAGFLNVNGQPGNGGVANIGGQGGSTIYGTGAPQTYPTSLGGAPGSVGGGGGAGACSNGSSFPGPYPGGVGGAGLIIVYEYS